MIGPALAVCYLVGSFPTAYVLAKGIKGIDIRRVGSGNVGATNVLRALGPLAGLTVLAIDILKGALAVTVVPRLLLGASASGVTVLACGVAAVLGHDFPVWLKFQGGKGVATTIGMLLASQGLAAAIVIGVWCVVFLLWRYVSVASVLAAAALPAAQWLTGHSRGDIALGVGIALLILVQHRSNLQRLRSGTEHRAWSKHAAPPAASSQ